MSLPPPSKRSLSSSSLKSKTSSEREKRTRISPLQCAQRWGIYLDRSPRHVPYHPIFENNNSNNNQFNKAEVLDPFDCSDCILPSEHELMEELLEDRVEQWKQLDARKIPLDTINESSSHDEKNAKNDNNNNNNNNDDDLNQNGDQDSKEQPSHRKPIRKRAHMDHTDYMNRIRLPHEFDYKSERGPPNVNASPLSNEKYRTKVISLNNPLEQLDYETELWKIFDSVPTREAFQRQVQSSDKTSCTHMKALRTQIDQAQREYSRTDCHALSRMRLKDRHHLPITVTSSSETTSTTTSSTTTTTTTNEISNPNSNSNESPYSTTTPTSDKMIIIRMECWKRHIQRGPRIASDKLEMEFMGTQTLLDVHRTIVQQASDPYESSFMNRDDSSSGMFFIENTFYITGNQNYALPILDWINEGNIQENDNPNKTTTTTTKYSHLSMARRDYLGIPIHQPLLVKTMSSIQLQHIPYRLGVRYVHTFHGDLECSLFFTDVRIVSLLKKNNILLTHSFPSILDPWSSSLFSVACDACQHSAAVVVCSKDELTCGSNMGGGTLSSEKGSEVSHDTYMCKRCFFQIHYNSQGSLRYNNFECFPMDLYKEDLSKSHESLNAIF